MEQLLSAEQVAEAMDGLYQAIVAQLPARVPLAIVGIRTRGEIIAQRLADRLAGSHKGRMYHGVLDITFYRDDLSRRKKAPLVRATELDFDPDDKLVLLVDDVLHTGRSVRAAIAAILDFGRPRAIRLAVLIDRGGRELPIAADFVGKRLEVPNKLRVQVQLAEHDGEDGAFLIHEGTAKP
ncbi:MAG: bifunctional pyr operon transcriptional regulator/uracil phosphoribosyltransferase PyrR [Planctomycetes bacterium]|nr:bifunctional pyr operon transcriptional regulator/uracil phosphoribosyltransferase PyrR [Planctomycetota bacterium]